MGDQALDMSQLSIEQLNSLKQQIEMEMQQMAGSVQKLKAIGLKYREAGRAVAELTPDREGKEIMVPITQSVFAPGRLVETDRVMVDIGTGFYVGKTIAEAKEFYTRKTSFVQQKSKEIEDELDQKRMHLQIVISMIQSKVRALQEQVRSQTAGSSA